MKKTSLFRPLFCIISIIALSLCPSLVRAQTPGIYSPLPSGMIVLPAASTNVLYVYTLTNGVPNGVFVTNYIGAAGTSSNYTLNVSEYDDLGTTWRYLNQSASTNANVGFRAYRSMNNGAVYETTPTFVFTNTPIAPGALTTATVTNLAGNGCTHLAFTVENNTGGAISNVLLQLNLKSRRLQTQAAGVNAGTSPGTPIVVPNQ